MLNAARLPGILLSALLLSFVQSVSNAQDATGSKVTVVLPQLRVNGNSSSPFSAAGKALTPDSTITLANCTTPPYSSTMAAVRSSMRAETD